MMKQTRKQSAVLTTLFGLTLLSGSCGTVHHYPPHRRPHRHHPHRHRIVIVAEQPATKQGKDCTTFEACLAMAEPSPYGSTE